MRCLILIALCFVLANASYFNRNRFQRLLNRYQNQNQNRYNLDGQDNWYGDLYGSDDVDDYIDDYVDQIRRERVFERDQCPRDIDGLFGLYGQEECDVDFEDILGGGRFTGEYDDSNKWYHDETVYGGRTNMDDIQGDDLYQGETQLTLLKEVEDANSKLACRLYKECKDERDDKNIVVSPVSIQLALAALNFGTRGNTKRQIGRVIGGRLQKNERRQVYKTLIRKLKGLGQSQYSTIGRKCQMKPITGIFLTQTTRAQQQFIQVIKNNLGATVKHCDFHRQPQQCRQMINRWMAQRTQGKINQVVPQDAITDNTKMVLVNSMQVKATWGQQMRRHVTKEAKFYPLDTQKVKIVEVMETQGRFKYYEDELVKIVGIPTEQRELTLYVIVPKDKDGLTEVEKLHLQDSVQMKQLLDIADRQVQHVGVQLPKFQIKHKVDVRRTLRKQGVTDVFDPLRADFSGITGVSKVHQDEMDDVYNPLRRTSHMDDEITGNWQSGTKLHLNKFIHQSTIKITENGITATTNSGNDLEDFEQYGHHGRMEGRFGGLEDAEHLGLSGLDHDESNIFDQITGFGRRGLTGEKVVKANHAFAFVLKHNPTKQVVFVGRVIDAAQKKITNLHQTINAVDQL